MRGAGYQNVERGEKGSDDENLHHTKFKTMKEKERLEMLQSKVELEQKALNEKQAQAEQIAEKLLRDKKALQDVKAKKTALKNVDAVAVKNAVMDSSKVVVDKAEFEDIKALAKKQIVHENREKKLAEDNKKLTMQVKELQKDNQSQKAELDSHRSVKNQLNIGKIMAENEGLKAFKEKVMKFIEKLGLKQEFDKFMKGNVEKDR